MESSKIDYLIIGQGLAGSCLALQLLFRDKKVLVYDQPAQNKSSLVAAGLFNPIIGKVMTHAWKSEVLFPALFDFYTRAEIFLGKKFFFPMPLYRPFSSVFEQNEWMAQSADRLFKNYIDSIFVEPTCAEEVSDLFGGLLLKQCGYLQVPKFMQATRELLIEKSAYRDERFDAQSLEITEAGFRYQQITASKIIFCGGMDDKRTDFFSGLPLRPLKGETLEIKLPTSISRIYNRGVYIVPSSFHTYKVGATYDPKDGTESTTQQAREELTGKLNELLVNPYEIVSHQWGFRPCANDRKPFVGQHPKINNLFILNGLGTKGVSLAPFFSHQLADFMEATGPIDAEASINRIKKNWLNE